jgi:hypothetical protein
MVPRTNRILKTKLQTENSDSFSFFSFVWLLFPIFTIDERNRMVNVSVVDDHLQLFLEVERARAQKKIRDCFCPRRFFRVLCVCVCLSCWLYPCEGLFFFFLPFFIPFYLVLFVGYAFLRGFLICVMWWSSSLETLRRPREGHIGPTGRCTIVKSKTQHYSLESIVFIYGLFFKRCRTIHSCVCVARLLITFQGKTRNISQDKNKKEKSVKVEPRYMAEGRIHEGENTHTSIHIYNSSTDIFLSSFLVPRWSECV